MRRPAFDVETALVTFGGHVTGLAKSKNEPRQAGRTLFGANQQQLRECP
jgi:hypothetical protein